MTALSDRELLELAAAAAGLTGTWVDAGLNLGSDATPRIWNAMDDDGDALRLAVKLDFVIEQNVTFKRCCVLAHLPKQLSAFAPEFFEAWNDDKQAATRRAITSAAAQIELARRAE